jgi:hypothetical protein
MQAFVEYFANPKAELEPWLLQVFIPPENLERFNGSEPFVLYGLSGSGKTALRLYLQATVPSHVLAVPWVPEPVTSDLLGTALADAVQHQLMQALLEWVILQGNLPGRNFHPPEWVKSAIAWYLRRYLPMDAAFYVQSFGADLKEMEINWYLDLLGKPEPPIFKTDASLNDQFRVLIRILQQFQYQSVWWMVDGLERWPPQSEKFLQAMLEALLSTLAVFDIPQYLFKLFVPIDYQEIIQSTSGVERHRIHQEEVSWLHEQLIVLIQRRLSFALQQTGFDWAKLLPDALLDEFLQDQTGQTPRQLLTLISRLFEITQTKHSLTSSDWRRFIQDAEPPRLRLNIERREVQIGEQIISITSENEFKILLYLYQRAGRICPIEEVYFCGVKGLARIPKTKEDGWVHKDYWRPALDTTIYRLRKKIEPSLDHPVYLVTHARKGLELRHILV